VTVVSNRAATERNVSF